MMKQSNLNLIKQTTVAPSPFNGIKPYLVIAIILGAVIWGLCDWWQLNQASQFLLLASYGILASGLIIIKTRTILRNYEQEVKK